MKGLLGLVERELDPKKKLELCFKHKESVLFLDIETEGLSKERNDITLIGIFKNGKYLPFIKGFNLERSERILRITPIWVTFGGERFDLPFIKKTFPDINYPILHIDLYFFTAFVGLKGGLKRIEKALGIERVTEGMNGYDAVKLWQRWTEKRDKKALRDLIMYNKEDVINLKKILEHVAHKIKVVKDVK